MAGGREGDWACPNPDCQNSTTMVFAKHDRCPKCKSPKGGFQGGGGQQPGDWSCPNTSCMNNHKLVFARHSSCPKCGSAPGGGGGGGCYGGGGGGRAGGGKGGGYGMPMHQQIHPMYGAMMPVPAFMPQQQQQPRRRQPDREPGGERPEDWQCPNTDCINHEKMVFGRHDACPSCGTSKDAKTPGDWQCPNQQCQNNRCNVFASKPQCPKCGAARPNKGNKSFAPTNQGYGQGYGVPQFMGGQQMQYMHQQPMMHQQAMVPVMYGYGADGGKGRGGGGQPSQASDWKCPNNDCINHTKMVFGRHEACPKCGSEKVAARQGAGAGRKGDWACPNEECLNHTKLVFGKHDTCPKCGQENPGGDEGGRGRSRSPRRF